MEFLNIDDLKDCIQKCRATVQVFIGHYDVCFFTDCTDYTNAW